ncbi:RNA 2',3'-cyclic phosphodiesterase [Pollutimonas sp. H1-120]|uniref:RNA 2',3'-cyclic phosphodiesterase n=1 Tax=Pollutimonas sp. H1-120 TaxID=3148824 RepID=UPI003B52B81E
MEQSWAAAAVGQAPQRIFFGLWPSAETAAQIMEWAHEAHALFGGRIMRPETLHLTLAFLGGTPAARVSELIQAVPDWQVRVETMVLRRLGRFAGPRIVWAGPSQDDAQSLDWLDTLHDDLWIRLEEMGWARPDMIFRPHISLLRKAGSGDVQGLRRPPIIWTPERCVLVASTPGEGGSCYRELARLPIS